MTDTYATSNARSLERGGKGDSDRVLSLRRLREGEGEPDIQPHILLAEDDAELRELIRSALRLAGYRVTVCGDGGRLHDLLAFSLALPHRSRFDVVVTDVYMPTLTGMDILEGLKHHDGLPPVILMTAFGSEHLHLKAEENGAAEVLDKPLELGDLLGSIRIALVGGSAPGAVDVQ